MKKQSKEMITITETVGEIKVTVRVPTAVAETKKRTIINKIYDVLSSEKKENSCDISA